MKTTILALTEILHYFEQLIDNEKLNYNVKIKFKKIITMTEIAKICRLQRSGGGFYSRVRCHVCDTPKLFAVIADRNYSYGRAFSFETALHNLKCN